MAKNKHFSPHQKKKIINHALNGQLTEKKTSKQKISQLLKQAEKLNSQKSQITSLPAPFQESAKPKKLNWQLIKTVFQKSANLTIYLWNFFWGKRASSTASLTQTSSTQANPIADSPVINTPSPSDYNVLAIIKRLKLLANKIRSLFGQKLNKTPRIKKILRIILFPILNPFCRYGVIILFFGFFIWLGVLASELPSPKRIATTDNFAVSTQIFDRNGELLYEIFAKENRTPIALKDLPPYVYQATIAIEDKNFYKHFGIDIQGIVRAIINNLKKETVSGGSTITQQLVKNALLSREKTFQRKIKEALLSVLTEMMYTKEEILEMYLNYISYGGTSLGIEAAANSYFDKHAKDLTLGEAALLAGLPQAPSKYSPFGSNPQQAKNRQFDVLRRMREDGYISPEEEKRAQEEILEYALSQTEIKAPHFVFYVRDLLYEKYGEEKVQKGGLRVTTTLDLNLQNVAQASLSAKMKTVGPRYKAGNAAALVTKPNTGEILAMIGSKDYFDATADGQVNVTISNRQPGSSIKPIMYATTFQQKTLSPGTILLDKPTCFGITGQKNYCPKNYDGSFNGPLTVRQSLANSLNIPAVKALSTIGVATFINQANKMGIESWQDPTQYGLSLTLGGGEVKMTEMAQAFGVIANQGVKVPLTPILEVKDYQGNVLESVNTQQRLLDLTYLTEYESSNKNDLERVMDRAPAYLVAHIMQDDQARSRVFGMKTKLTIPGQIVSAKTGTTNNSKDNWTVGFTPEFLTVIWVGNNNSNPMAYSADGITTAAPIWNDIMSYILKDKEAILLDKPDDVKAGMVCVSGMPPSKESGEGCGSMTNDLYWEKSQPANSKQITKDMWIDPTTGQPPKYGEQKEGLILENHTLYTDPTGDSLCTNCILPTNEEGKIIYDPYLVKP